MNTEKAIPLFFEDLILKEPLGTLRKSPRPLRLKKRLTAKNTKIKYENNNY